MELPDHSHCQTRNDWQKYQEQLYAKMNDCYDMIQDSLDLGCGECTMAGMYRRSPAKIGNIYFYRKSLEWLYEQRVGLNKPIPGMAKFICDLDCANDQANRIRAYL